MIKWHPEAYCKKNVRLLVVLLCLVVHLALARGAHPVAHAGNGSGNWRHLNTDSEPELLSNGVRAVAFERDAVGIPTLWVGTDRGLQSFDGREWKGHTTPPNSDINNRDVQALARDDQGTLWVASATALNWREAAGKWNAWPFDPDGPAGQIHAIVPLPDGRVMVTSAGAPSLGLWDRGNKQWSSPELGLGAIRDVLVAGDSAWLATARGAARLNLETLQTDLTIRPSQVGLSDTVRALTMQGDGTLWVGTATGLVGVPAGSEDSPRRWDVFGPGRPSLANHTVDDLLWDNRGVLWVATDGGGLSRYDPLSKRWNRYFHDRDGLLSDHVRQLLLDDQGTLWVVTAEGISGLDFTWRDFTPATTASGDYIGANDVRALWGDGQGAIWIGTDGGGVSFSTDGGERWTTLSSANSGLTDDRVLSLWGDGQGTVWIGTENGLARWVGDGASWTIAPAYNNLPAEPIYALWGSTPDTVWVGTPSGLYYSLPSANDAPGPSWKRYSGVSEGFSSVEQDPSRTVIAGQVQALWGYGSAVLWVGTNEGLYQISGDLASAGPTLFTTANGLPDNDIQTLGGAFDGRPWVGTRLGLGRPDPGDRDSWIPLTADGTEGAFPANIVHALWVSGQAQVWAGTENGLAFSLDGETWDVSLSGAVEALWGNNQGQVWAGGPGKMAYSLDWGNNWTDCTTDERAATGLRNALVHDVLYDPSSGTLWAATETGLSNSTDGGQTWNAPLAYRDLGIGDPLAIQRTAQGTLWVIGALGVARSQDGETLALPAQPAGGRINALWIGGGPTGNTVWLGSNGGLYRSDDDGQSWQMQPTPEQLGEQGVRAVTGHGDALWIGTHNGFLARLQDDRWRIVDDFAGETIHDLCTSEGHVMMATERGLHLSADDGQSWQLINTTDGLPDNDVRAIYVHPDSGDIWLGTASAGLAQSRDGGMTWRALDARDGLSHNQVYAITSSGEPENAVWIATAHGLARYAPRSEVRPWVRLLQVNDGQKTFNRPASSVRLLSDEQLQVQFEGGSLIALPTQVRYEAALTSKDPLLSLGTESAEPASPGNPAAVLFAAGEDEQLDGDYTLSIVAIDQESRPSEPTTLIVIAPATAWEKLFKWFRGAALTILLVAGGLVLVGGGVLWSLSHNAGLPPRVLLRQGVRIPFASLGYRGYRHRWEAATPLERLLTLMAPTDRTFTQAEAADWLQEHSIPSDETTLERTLASAVRDGLLYRAGNQYSLVEKALNRTLQDHQGPAGLKALMRQVRNTHPLVAEAYSLFTAAGFTLQEVHEPLSFLCQPVVSFWTRQLEKGVYTRVLPGVPLNGEAVRTLQRDASSTNAAGPVILVVIDTHPDDSGWDAISELRAAGFTIVPIDDSLIQSWQAHRREQHDLAEHLDRFLDPDYDPYVTLPSTSGALGYFGHRELVHKLLKRLEQGHATALIGLRKMGTSSTLRYLQDQTRWPSALVDLQASPDLPTILSSAMQEWRRSARRKLDLNLTSPPETEDPLADFTTSVAHFVQQLQSRTNDQSARLVFLLDEIELLVPKSDASGPKLTHYLTLARLLKGLVQEELLSLVVAANDSQFNRVSLWGEHTNPFYLLFREQFLPPLSPGECDHMVRNIGRQIGLTYDQETLDFIAQASGGHPYLARQLCSLAYQSLRRAGAVPLDVVHQAAERFVRNPRTAAFVDDNGLWGYLGQPDLWGLMGGRANQAVLIDLTVAPQPLAAQELKEGPNPEGRASAIFALRELWVIRPADPTASPAAYEISFGLLRDWIALNREKESPKLQLQQEAQEFFNNSGFDVRPLDEKGYTPWDFFCDPHSTGWRRRFEHPVYTAIVARQALDDQAVLAIREAALAHSPSSGVALAVIDERPDDTAWLQIATLRASGFSLVLIPQTLIQDGRARQKERLLLRHHLDRELGRGHNPYDVRGPVYDVLNFFGRQALADQMMARLVAAQPLAILGLRKMGKSSLLYYLRNRAPFPVALVDLQSETELRAIYHEIMRSWSRSLYIKFDFDWPVPILPATASDLPAIFRDVTTNLLETLAQLTPEPKLGIFMDEIEQIVPRPKEFGLKLHQYLAFMRGLRGIIQESEQLALLVAGVNPALNRISRYGDEQNPAYQLFQEIFLPPLTVEDCSQMVRNIGRQVGLRFPQTAIDVVNAASGGHPFLARQLCSQAYNELERAGQINAPLLRATVDTFIRNPKSAANLNENGMWGEVTQLALWEPEIAAANQQILEQLAAADAPLTITHIIGEEADETLEDALFALQNRWVISKAKRRRGPDVYEITFGLLRRWIRRHFGLPGSASQ